MKRSELMGGSIFAAAAPPPVAAPAIVSRTPQPPALAICIPSFSTFMADTSMALTAMVAYLVQRSVARVAMCNQKASMITMARNDLVERALELNADYLLFVDSDLIFPADAAARLMRHNKDIVGATYNKRVPPYETLGKLKGLPPAPEVLAKGGLYEADYLPGGFMLFKADVFRRLEWPWFFECYNRRGTAMEAFVKMMKDIYMLEPPQGVVDALTTSKELSAWLDEDWPLEPGNRVMSEDYSFMRKARRAGYQIWCDLDLTWELKHIGEQAVSCLPPGADKKPTPAIVTV